MMQRVTAQKAKVSTAHQPQFQPRRRCRISKATFPHKKRSKQTWKREAVADISDTANNAATKHHDLFFVKFNLHRFLHRHEARGISPTP
jgi:hypothetical protein